jgi:hypothetical protein
MTLYVTPNLNGRISVTHTTINLQFRAVNFPRKHQAPHDPHSSPTV